MITMTSVGYGDIFPKTFWGRMIGIVVSFWGVLVMSMVVVIQTEQTSFSRSEKKAIELINVLHEKHELKRRSVQVFGEAFKLKKSKMEPNATRQSIAAVQQEFRSRML